MKRPLIIGYGNPLREDDGIGSRAAELVEQSLAPGVAGILQCRQLTPELALEVENASLVIFLDAAVGPQAGSISMEAIYAAEFSSWTHHFTPRQLLGLVKAPPPAYWITCGAAALGWRENLTPQGEASAVKMAEAALKLLRERAWTEHTQPDAAQATHTIGPDQHQ